MALNIGINVVEFDGRGAPALAGAATSTGAFCIGTSRGVPDRPALVTSFAQFTERFGGFDAARTGTHLVKGFFDNGGRQAWVTRVVAGPANSRKGATDVLRQRPADNSKQLFDVTAGSRGSADPGAWANGYVVTLQPSLTVSVGGALTATTAVMASTAGLAEDQRIVIAHGEKRQVSTITDVDVDTRTITWADAIAADLADFQAAGTTVSTTACDLVVQDPDGNVRETIAGLSLAADAVSYAPTVVNDARQGSKYVTLKDKRTANSQTADDAPAGPVTATLAGGAANAAGAGDYEGDPAKRTGLRAFDPLDVQLVTVDSTDRTAIGAALDYCEQRGDCMFVGAVPQGAVGDGSAVETGGGLQAAKRYGALYGPWILVTAPGAPGGDPTEWVPPSGHVMGVYARIESSRGIHKAPAGDEARVFGALDVEYRLSDVDHTDLAERGGVNGIRVVPGAGIVVDASRTLSTDVRWRYVNVRLLFNYVKSSLRQGLRWVRQEPNRDTLWTAVTYGSVRPFLMGLWRQGAFGTGDPDEVFTIVCDATNNPPDEVDKGNFTLEVTLYPSKPAEKVLIRVGQQPSGSSASEA
jgi:phage tail sheath protein FI